MTLSAKRMVLAVVLTCTVFGPVAVVGAAGAGHGPDVAHDHDAAHDRASAQTGVGRRLVDYVGKFHPMAVHFPIALMVAAALAELLGMATGREMFTPAARFSVWCAGISAVAAAGLGWCFAGFQLVDPMQLKTVHRWVGTAAGLWAIPLVFFCHLSYREGGRTWRKWYMLVLFVGVALVGAAGLLGGALIYGWDHLAW